MARKKFKQNVYLDLRKRNRNTFFWILFLDILAAVDLPFPPIPAHVNAAVVVALTILGLYYYRKGFSLDPAVKNAPFVALNYNGMMSIPILAYELDISLQEARIILSQYAQSGFLILIHDSDNLSEKIFRFSGEEEIQENQGSRPEDITEEIRSINERLINGNLSVTQSGIFERDEDLM